MNLQALFVVFLVISTEFFSFEAAGNGSQQVKYTKLDNMKLEENFNTKDCANFPKSLSMNFEHSNTSFDVKFEQSTLENLIVRHRMSSQNSTRLEELKEAFKNRVSNWYGTESGKSFAFLILQNNSHHSNKRKHQNCRYDLVAVVFPGKNETDEQDIHAYRHISELVIKKDSETTTTTNKTTKTASTKPGSTKAPTLASSLAKANSTTKTTTKKTTAKPTTKTTTTKAPKKNPVKLCVEIMAVVDHSVFESHMKFLNTTDTNLTYSHMKLYFEGFFERVNELYEKNFEKDPDLRLSVKLKHLVFLSNRSESFWTNPKYVGDQGTKVYRDRPVLVTTLTITAFKVFLRSAHLPYEYDHAIGIFNKDLWSRTNSSIESRQSVSGFAVNDKICTDKSFSIVEDIGGFIHVPVVAHELAHSLGAIHDGDPKGAKECRPADNFLMTPDSGMYPENLQNAIKFSNCSIALIKNNILNENKTSPSTQAECLANIPKGKPANQLLKWSADDQCKMIYGSNASFCQFTSGKMCQTLFCRKSPEDTKCLSTIGMGATTGTVCGSGKSCLNGQCVNNTKIANMTCPFGDDVVMGSYVDSGLPNKQMGCKAVLEYMRTKKIDVISFCRNEYLGKSCCKSCQKYDEETCFDRSLKCAKYENDCEKNYLKINGIYVRDYCAYTCKSCSRKNESVCENEYCQNGGKCVSKHIKATNTTIQECKCRKGYFGESCELKDACLPNPCKNETCTRVGAFGFVCNQESLLGELLYSNINPKGFNLTEVMENFAKEMKARETS